MHEEHAHVYLAEAARDGRIGEDPHGGDEGLLHGHLSPVEGEEGAKDVAQLAGQLHHGVIPDQQQPGEGGCTLYTVHCTLYTQCTQCTLYTVGTMVQYSDNFILIR